jgi:hypothetical protein
MEMLKKEITEKCRKIVPVTEGHSLQMGTA